MADTFNPVPKPSPGSTFEREYRAQVAQYGDGYEQRVADGIQTRRLKGTLEWPVLGETERDTLVAWFDAHPSWVSWLWTIPGESTPRLWRVETISENTTGPRRRALTVSIVEVLDP